MNMTREDPILPAAAPPGPKSITITSSKADLHPQVQLQATNHLKEWTRSKAPILSTMKVTMSTKKEKK